MKTIVHVKAGVLDWSSRHPDSPRERIKAKPYCKHCKEYGHSIHYCREKHAENSARS